MKVGAWTPIGSLVPESQLWAMRTGGLDLAEIDPLRVAAGRFAAGKTDLGRLMVDVVGTRIANRDELVLLVADHGDQASSGHFWAEEVVDSACSAAHASSAAN